MRRLPPRPHIGHRRASQRRDLLDRPPRHLEELLRSVENELDLAGVEPRDPDDVLRAATDDIATVDMTGKQIAGAKKVALMASRTNTLLSIPMLMCMVGHMHTLPF